MKRLNFLKLLSLVMFSIFSSCSTPSFEETIDGKQSDTIGLSINDTTVDSNGKQLTATTQGMNWKFSEIYDNSKMIEFDNQTTLPFSINGEWFSIVKQSETKFAINVSPNKTEKCRVLEIVMVDRNYSCRLNISQNK